MSLGEANSPRSHAAEDKAPRPANARLLLETNLGVLTAIGTGLNTPDGYQQVVVRHLRRITGARVVSSRTSSKPPTRVPTSMRHHPKRRRQALKVCDDLRLLLRPARWPQRDQPAEDGGRLLDHACKVSPSSPGRQPGIASKS